MKTSSENNFEKQWQEVFNNASVQPPSDLWNRISTNLDAEKKSKPLFMLWGLPGYVVSGIAAALILVVSGLFVFNSVDTIPKNTAQKTVKETVQSAVEKETLNEAVSGVLEEDKLLLDKAISSNNTAAPMNASEPKGVIERNIQLKSQADLPLNQTVGITEEGDFRSIAKAVNEEATVASFLKKVTNNLKKLSGHEVDTYATRFTMNRNKLAYVEPEEATFEPKKVKKRSWIGLISGLSPFKPNFQPGNLNSMASDYNNVYFANKNNFDVTHVPGAPNGSVGAAESILGNNFVSNASTPVQQFSNGRAINLGIQAGHQLTKSLSVETGVRYLQGNANVISNVYGFDERTGDVNAFYQDYLSNTGLRNGVVGSSETISTEYQYLMVPVQLAYKIPIVRKLNAEVLGGVSADMFLKYKLESESTNVATLDPSNSVFRALGMSGLGGVRLNYVFDEKWELSVGSAFQHALVSNFKSGTSATLRPQALGVNYGVNYHF